MSMQTGAPTFGTPEPSLVLYVVRPARPAARRAVPIRRLAVRVEAARRASGVRVGQHAAGDRARRRQLRAPRRGLARGRPRDRLREVRPRRRPARHDGHVRARRRPVRERPGARRDPRERTRAALPRHRAHARQLRERLLPVDHRRQRELRAVARRRRARRRAARQRDLEAAGSPRTSRRRSTTPIDEELRDVRRPAASPRCPTRSADRWPTDRAVGRPGVRGAAPGRDRARRHQRRGAGASTCP